MRACYRFLRTVGFASLLLLGAGCKGEQPYGVVEGVVTLDGKPLTSAEVVFMPDPEKGGTGRRSVALTDNDGRYRIASDTGRAGAPVGFHRVCVNDLLLGPPGVGRPPVIDDEPKGLAGIKGPDPSAGSQKSKKSRFPVEYSSANATPLRDIEVREGTQVINVELKSNLTR